MKNLAALNKRRAVTIGVTLFLALMSGHLMQSVLTDRVPVVVVDTGPKDTVQSPSVAAPDLLPVLPVSLDVPALPKPPVMPSRVDEASLDRTVGCDPTLQVTPAPAATLRIDLLAPCAPNQQFILRHGPLTADVVTDAQGQFQARIPALEEQAQVLLEFPEIALSADATISDQSDFHHVILQWHGAQTLKLNAYEFGASDGESGHVWPGSPKSPERALDGRGFLTSLGRQGGDAFQIYSVPVRELPDTGVIRLVVDAEIMPNTCGRDLRAVAFQTGPLGRLSRSDIRVTLPDCDRVGDVLRLQNLFSDMRLALR